MKKLAGVFLSVLILTSCASIPAPEATKGERTFFDAGVVERFIPGKTTQDEILKTLGQPYPDPLKTPERWTYMYTFQKQIIFKFKEGILTAKEWSTEYGIHTGTKD